MNKKRTLGTLGLFVLLSIITMVIIGYCAYPYEKSEPMVFSFEENWPIGSYEIGYDQGTPLLNFSYNGFNYTTNPERNDFLVEPKKASLEKIIDTARDKEVENYQNFFKKGDMVYSLYVVIVDKEVYYSAQKIYEEYAFYNLDIESNQDTIKVFQYPDMTFFLIVLIVVSLFLSGCTTLVIRDGIIPYLNKRKK